MSTSLTRIIRNKLISTLTLTNGVIEHGNCLNGHYFKHILDGWGSLGVDNWNNKQAITLVMSLPLLGIDGPEDWFLTIASAQISIRHADIM